MALSNWIAETEISLPSISMFRQHYELRFLYDIEISKIARSSLEIVFCITSCKTSMHEDTYRLGNCGPNVFWMLKPLICSYCFIANLVLLQIFCFSRFCYVLNQIVIFLSLDYQLLAFPKMCPPWQEFSNIFLLWTKCPQKVKVKLFWCFLRFAHYSWINEHKDM